MIVSPEILEDLYMNSEDKRIEKAKEYVKEKRINITKVIYTDAQNFEIHSKVKGNESDYNVYIKAEENELQSLSCTCEDYHTNYLSCKHIISTMMEFANNEKYIRIFAGENKAEQNDLDMYKKYDKHEEKYRVFKQLINTFYNQNNNKNQTNKIVALPHTIKIEPKIIYNTFQKTMKLEFKVGDKQLYKLKSLPEFYDRMLNNEVYQYGSKLEFIHNLDAFEQDSIPLLNFILKYAEIIKYANEATNNYNYYGKTMVDNYITVSNSGMDELFEVFKGQQILFQKEYAENKIFFNDQEPKIEFYIEEINKNEYKITTNIDIYEYEVIEGKEYTYILMNNILYRCGKEFKENTLKLLQIFKNNFTTQIDLRKSDLPQLFSLVIPKIKEKVKYDNLNKEEIEKYIPKDLYVKLFLDYNEKNYITADVKFVYGDIEFNPLLEPEIEVARNIVKEDEVLEMFRQTGFMLDTANARLILVNEEAIYNFLSTQIEEYMQKFEVLATESFKQKEIKEPKIATLGIKIENNLLALDLSNLDFEPSEIKEIMSKYRLKKKYHRLKDGSFIKLEENETINFLDNITSTIDINFKEIQNGELKLPMYRSMYLDRLLQNLKNPNIIKSEEYKNLINKIEDKELKEENQIPKDLKTNLRNYQKIGFQWLKTLDEYNFGGILADDMGLGKTIQLLAIILSYVDNTKNSKPSIVVCPSSLSLNWYNEINKFAPKIKSLVIHGNMTERSNQLKQIEKYNIVITSYDLLKRDIETYKELNYQFKYIIADEAQYIKNNNTQNAKAIKEITAETRYALTGTPIENSLSELWSIFDFIMPGYLFGYKKFKENFEAPIVKEEDKNAMNKLKMLIEPFILRRIKSEVLTELPDKTITVLNNEMQDEQLKVYMSYMQNAKQEAIQEIQTNGFERSQIKILALLMRLRQICCHPGLFIDNYDGESSKLNQCMEVVKDAIESGHKILLFSGYTTMFEILEKELKKEKIKYFKLTGQTKVGERINLVDEFNENEEVKVFLISLKAGGTGLNLIGADMVIHYDPWWNLSAENQATDRTYRIGQKKNVQVYKLITKNSIEEKIYDLQQKKAKLIDNVLDTNQTFISKLSKDDIMELFK